MKKLWHTLLLSTALVTVSCSKSDEPSLEPKAEKQAKTFGLSLSVDLEDLQLGDDARLMSYDLEGDKKLMKINLLRIKKETPENLKTKNKVGTKDLYKVPVHVFFKNKKTNALVYKQLFMDIAGEKSLYLPFTELSEVCTKFTDDNANDWYMKGVIGGTALPQRAPTYVHHCHDYLYDITDQTESFITVSSAYSIPKGNPWTRMSLPFPMETPWTKVQFYYKEGHTQLGDDAKRPEYPDALQKLRFQPLGSVMRLKISNQSSSDYTFQTFYYTPARGGETQTMGYVNNVSRYYNQPITDESLTDIQKGVRVVDNIGGGLHYHSTGSAYSQQPYPITIAQGGARYVFFWITKSQNQVSETKIQPYLYNAYRIAAPTTAKNFSPIYLTEHKNLYGSPNNDGGVMVSTSKYREGYTYFINSVLR